MPVTYSRALAFKAAMYAACQSLFPDLGDNPVRVSYGHPGTIPDELDLVVLGAVRSQQNFATMGTNRTREETLELDVQFNSRSGDDTNGDQAAAERAYTLLGQLENYVRTTDSNLGVASGVGGNGIVRWCFLTSHTSTGMTDPGDVTSGRWIVLDATFTAPARVSNS